MIRAAFGQGAQVIDIIASTTDYNLFQAAGSPVTARRVVVNISAGVIVGATSVLVAAFDTGQFPTGTEIEIYNNGGEFQGAGGAASGGTGGTAIKANYPNQKITIYNNGGKALGGGGGGAKGGNGGTGGKGGDGTAPTYQYSRVTPSYHSRWEDDTNNYFFVWNNVLVASGSQPSQPPASSGPYLRGPFVVRETITDPDYGSISHVDWYQIGQNVTTTGGIGGAGGIGGNGGKGRGYEGAATNGAVGGAGGPGAAGGTNAGQGGTGGTGGNGGAGGDWGTNGAAGTAGATGATGTNGNASNGLAGAAGAAAGAVGLAGYYLLKGTADVTFINNGGIVAGRVG